MKKREWAFHSIRSKVAMMAFIVISCIAMLVGMFVSHNVKNLLYSHLYERFDSLAETFAYGSEYGLLVDDRDNLLRLAETLTKETDVAYAFILRSDGELVTPHPPRLPLHVLEDFKAYALKKRGLSASRNYKDVGYEKSLLMMMHPVLTVRSSAVEEAELFDYAEEERSDLIGYAVIGFSMNRVLTQVERLKDGVFVIAGLTSLGIMIFIFIMTNFIARTLKQILEGMQSMEQGDHTVRLHINTNDELEDVARGFNQMAVELQRTTVSRDSLVQQMLERKEAERAMERFRRQNELILNSAGEGIYGLDVQGNATFVNPAAARMLGWSIEELIGQPLHKLIHHSKPDGTPYPQEKCPIYSAFKDGSVHSVDKEVFWRKDGGAFPVEYVATPIVEGDELVGAVVTFRDISERKLADQKINEQAVSAKLLHRAAALATEQLSLEETLHRTIELVCKTMKWAVGHVYMRSAQDSSRLESSPIWFMEDKERYALFQEVTEKTGFSVGQGLPGRILKSGRPEWIRDLTKDPSFIRVEAGKAGLKGGVGIPVTVRGEIVGVLEFYSKSEIVLDSETADVLWNVSQQVDRVLERMESAQSERKLLKEAEAARDEALRASKTKSEFLATMSHEIRTPMNAILGMADLLSDVDDEKERKIYLDTLKRNSQNLLDLINDILDISKVEAGRLVFEEVDFNLEEVIFSVQELMELRASEKGVQLTQSIEAGLPERVRGDANRLRQVLVNLVGNAVKFTKDGSIHLEVKRLPSSAKQIKGKTGILFTVKDTGVGIPTSRVNKIFDAFTQADSSTTRKYGGTGLGLAICKNLVARMDGEVWAESTLGRGSTFYFTAYFNAAMLPEKGKAVHSGTGAASRQVSAGGPSRGGGPMRILLVEDNEDNQLLVKSYLKKKPYILDVAGNGQEACDKFKERVYHLVLMDIHMPVMDGYAATKAIRAWELEQSKQNGKALSRVPILALSASGLIEDVKKSLDVGCDAHLTKPVRRDLVLQVIQKYENGKEGGQRK